MILADTSVWVQHLDRRGRPLEDFLNRGMILIHPFVIGELALGNLRRRSSTLADLALLPTVIVPSFSEVQRFIELNKIHGRGIGYVDANLLAATRLTHGATLWTFDKRLQAVASSLKLAA